MKREAVSESFVGAETGDPHLIFLLTVLGVFKEMPANGAALGGAKELLLVVVVFKPTVQQVQCITRTCMYI